VGKGGGSKVSKKEPARQPEARDTPRKAGHGTSGRGKRISEQVIAGVIVLAIGGLGGYMLRNFLQVESSSSQASPTVEKEIRDIKCFVYAKEYNNFYRRCKGRHGEILPTGACLVGDEIEEFTDPLPSIEVDLKKDCQYFFSLSGS